MSGGRHELSWRAVRARRLARHGLVGPVPPARLAELVGVMCGAHAQVLSAAEVSVALRVAGATAADVRAELGERRSLVKTFGPRGTVHLLAAADLPWWCAALSALPSTQGGQAPGVRLGAGQEAEVLAALSDALGGGAELTVEELDEAVVARAGAWAGERVMPAFTGWWPRWRQVLSTAAHRGVLCFGLPRGRKVTYASAAPLLGGPLPAAEEAGAWVVRRYLHAYGPATPQELARWLAVPPAWAVGRVKAMADELVPVSVEGRAAWVLAGDEVAGDGPERLGGVRLLPHYDAYVVGCHPRDRVFPGVASERALARGQAGPFPVLLVDGVAAGVWHQRKSGRQVSVTVEPFGPFGARRRHQLDAQVGRLGQILDARPELTIGPVTVGRHL